nr:serine hydrolase [Clavibacter michiganensis]
MPDEPESDRSVLVTWSAEDDAAAAYSPVTIENVETRLSYVQLTKAAVSKSDNTAMNLLSTRLGGPETVDVGLSALGDDVSEVVNVEPTHHTIEPRSVDDTGTPQVFTSTLTQATRCLGCPGRLADQELEPAAHAEAE